VDEAEARRRFASAPVARMATVTADGRPHVVPVTFVVVGATVWTAVDDVKPKRTTRLRRLDNVAANPAVSYRVDQYDDDWSRLWWVRADGTGRVAARVTGDALLALCARYPEYAARPPAGPALAVRVERWTWWDAQSAPSSHPSRYTR
jgi:PPOX class probable F420-dependent enzyme